MEKFQNNLIKFGTIVSENKYLKSIKQAFLAFMPFTIIGAVAILWGHVVVNDSTGLGALWAPIMGLDFLNPVFNAMNFCTIGCISLWIAFFLGSEIAGENKIDKTFGGVLAVISLIAVTNVTTNVLSESGDVLASVSGIFSDSLGTSGLFTAMIVSVLSVELYSKLFKFERIKIKMPEQVPPGVANSFESLIPAFLVILIVAGLGELVLNLSGSYLNDLIFNLVQTPLLNIGGSLPGMLMFIIISCLFWSVGLHGDNMIDGVVIPIITTLMIQNTQAVEAGEAATNIINFSFYRTFMATGGTGFMISLTIAIWLVAKRKENKAIAKLAIVPNLFNIGEVNFFGLPLVLNPIIIIPFLIVPLVTTTLAYFLTAVGICPIMYIQVPWTTPPFLMGFLATGGNVMGGLVQLLCIAVGVVIYLPFVKMYEKQQAQIEQDEAKIETSGKIEAQETA